MFIHDRRPARKALIGIYDIPKTKKMAMSSEEAKADDLRTPHLVRILSSRMQMHSGAVCGK